MEDAFQLSAISEYDYLTKSMTDHTQKNIDDGTFALAEYSALREEVLKRIELQNQILNLTLIIAGTAASVGYQFNSGPIILLFYPLIALVLSASWEQNNLRVRQIGVYIREKIESRTSSRGWEQYRAIVESSVLALRLSHVALS